MRRIGLSYAPPKNPYPRYVEAVKAAAVRLGLDIDLVDLWEHPESAESVDGVIFTGGADISPHWYGKTEEVDRCGELDLPRDEHELDLFKRVKERVLPVLGICRGAQLVNVAFGGTLITDIPHASDHVRRSDKTDARHGVAVREGSLIAEIGGTTRTEVNSSHHQAVDRLADAFVATARADDGTIEAYEWAQSPGKPFFLAVQWHPERMDQSESLAGPLFDCFLSAVASATVRL